MGTAEESKTKMAETLRKGNEGMIPFTVIGMERL